MNALAKRSMLELDETYKVSRDEIAEEANVEEFDDTEVIDAEVVEVEGGEAD